MPGTPEDSMQINSCDFSQQQQEGANINPAFTDEETETGILRNSLKVTQLECGRVGV